MSTLQKHIIQKQIIDLRMNENVDGFHLQNKVSELCRSDLQKQLEQLLDKYNYLEDTIRIDQLIIDVDLSSIDEFESNFVSKVLERVEKSIEQKIQEVTKDVVYPAGNRRLALLIHCLQNGFLPWWSPVAHTKEWDQYLKDLFATASASDWELIIPVLRTKSARERLIGWFSDSQFRSLIQVFSKRDSGLKHHFDRLLSDQGQDFFPNKLKNVVLQLISDETESESTTTSSKRLLKPASYKDKSTSKTGSSSFEKLSENQEQTPQEAIYINNAGLVIVAPYLPEFFKRLGLIYENEFTDISKAVALLNYIVFSNNEYAEFECVLPKILLGLEINTLVLNETVSADEKKAVNELLEAIIQNWSVLKNTSVEGLQTSFLQREGRLSFKDNEWTLLVKQEAYDMLLAQIPWNFSLTRLSWMQAILKVEWI